MDIKAGLKTVELWAGVVLSLVVLLVPDFPQDSAIIVLTWLLARIGEKVLSAPEKASWKTSEFWAAIFSSLAVFIVPSLYPDAPKESINTVMQWAQAYIIGRPSVKIAKNFDLGMVLAKLSVKKTDK